MEHIKLYENVLTKEECEELILLYESNHALHYDGYMGANHVVDKSYKNCEELMLKNNIASNKINKMNNILGDLFRKYKSENPFLNGDYLNEVWRIKKYNKNIGFYDWHVDISSKVSCPRVLAVIFYLNTVVEGGETSFSLDNKIIKIKPKIGSVLMFPANFCYPHKGEIPKSSDKYLLATFIVHE